MINVSPVIQNSPWFSLPDEIKLQIIKFVPNQYLIPLNATCRDFHRLVCTQIKKEDSVDYCLKVAALGELKLLQWARANGAPWNVWTCTYAAEGGHLEVLQWARANGAPWDERTCANAAKGGHLEVLQWAKANGAP